MQTNHRLNQMKQNELVLSSHVDVVRSTTISRKSSHICIHDPNLILVCPGIFRIPLAPHDPNAVALFYKCEVIFLSKNRDGRFTRIDWMEAVAPEPMGSEDEEEEEEEEEEEVGYTLNLKSEESDTGVEEDT
jgi:hypothetical protein